MSNSAEKLLRVNNSEDVMTVGDLIELLKHLDPMMWACVTIEGHDYPLSICNAGVLETSKSGYIFEKFKDIKMFFLDINHHSFMDFLEKEIVNPIKKQILQSGDI